VTEPRAAPPSPAVRIGHGFDAHRFGEGDGIVIGGVRIPFTRGIVAHSDGDVLIHALCDALLGAIGLGDIGARFPDTDPRFRGADSRTLLRDVCAEVERRGWRVANVDVTVIAEAPRLAPHIDAMRARLSDDLGVDPERVNVKATTTERMGYLGRGEGLASHAVVLLERA
jgi:2-C-methyl-D-erythritol 2,4-cyclodiphosphate synthase